MTAIRNIRLYIREDTNSHEEQAHIARILAETFGDTLPASSWIVVSGLSLTRVAD